MKRIYQKPDCFLLLLHTTDVMTVSNPVEEEQMPVESEGRGDSWDW